MFKKNHKRSSTGTFFPPNLDELEKEGKNNNNLQSDCVMCSPLSGNREVDKQF